MLFNKMCLVERLQAGLPTFSQPKTVSDKLFSVDLDTFACRLSDDIELKFTQQF